MHLPDSTLPHGTEPTVVAGNTTNPTKALLLLHGRGARAENIMHLTNQLVLSDDYLILAPQAANYVWYPERFVVLKKKNQTQLDSAIDRITNIVSFLETEFNIKSNQIILAGFSQGACLVAEYLKQRPLRYKGVAIFSGGLIGSDREVTESVQGDLHGTSIYMGCDVADFHIPENRVIRTAHLLTQMGATVDLKLYEQLGHSIHPEGLVYLQKYIDS